MDAPLNVLLVEDSEDDALLVLRILKRSGLVLHWQRVETAAALAEAVTQPAHWDLVISDYRLPGFNAEGALEIIRQHQLDIPFIVVSGTIGETTAVELMRAGAQDYLMKDNLARLPEAVRREVRDAHIRAERNKTAQSLSIAREHLQLAIEGSGIGTWDWDIATGAVQINQRCMDLVGYQPDKACPLTFEFWQCQVHPQDQPQKQKALADHFAGKTPTYECEFRLRHDLGHWVWVLDRGRIVERDPHGQPLRMAGTYLDISDRKRAELRQTLQNAILERIAQLDPLPDILEGLVRVAEAHLEGGMGSIMVCDRSHRLRHGASPNLPAAYSQALDGMLIGAEAGSCGTAAFCRETVIVADIATDPLWQDFKALALSYGLRSCWSAPAVGSDDAVLATCAVYFSHIRSPQPSELAILTMVADIAKIAIERHRAAAAVARRDRYLWSLVEVQSYLLTPDINPAVYQTILNVIGPLTEADRIYIFENHVNDQGELCTSQKAEWCAPGVTPQIDNPSLTNLPYSQGIQRWLQVLSRGETIQGTISEFPAGERAILEGQNIQAILVLPLMIKDQLWGFIGLDNCRDASTWSTLELWMLSSVSTAISLAKERELASRALAQLNRDLETRIIQRTAALQDSESKLQAILNFAPAAIYVKDLEGRHTLVNNAMQRFLNRPTAEIIGKRNDELFDPETAARLNQNDQAVSAAGQVQQFEEEVRVGPQVHTFLSNKFLLFDNSQQPYAICGISADITDRKSIQATLRRKEVHLRHIATNVPGVIFQYALNPNGTGQIAYVSDRVQDIFELSPAAVQAEAKCLFQLVHPDDYQHLRDSLNHAIHKLEKWTWEGRIITPSGQQKWIQGIGHPEHDTDGSTFCDGILLDVTVRKEAEILLKKTNAELARATRLKDEFLANMSHELRTPLNAVLGITEGLQEGVFGTLDERQAKATETIRESGQHLLDLINDILDFSKVEAGKLELSMAELSVRELCEASLRFVQHLAFKKHIELSFNLPEPLQAITLRGDERRLRQALINLLNNAVKFTPIGGKVSLSVRLEVNECLPPLPVAQAATALPALCFVVSDTGIGIAPENIDKLFKSFVQIDSCLNRQYDGTGLGLALVKRLTHLHGGTVGVCSTPGQGSSFAIRLPYNFSPTLGASRSSKPSLDIYDTSVPLSTEPPQAIPQSPLILFFGQDRAETQTFANYLKAKKYRITTTQSEQQLLHLAHIKRPDLLLFDSVTSVLDERHILYQFLGDQQFSSMPIMVLSDLPELDRPTEREKWIQAGVAAHLTKPVKLKVLATTIQQLLNKIDKHR